ncbi:TetR/AcrR family transcriptional regulator [Halomonas sp. NO4]|uniref:TetR/AcrR family transcriptional regulator n=1 Tax=Halomonas sp. NO4 TaxID=2484813 RepID=UPI0013D6F1A1|nr:TetR/AcrR family transcriptional regulator [Halomonas sp. NO4]
MVRDKEQTRQRLIEAVGTALSEHGFQGLGVNAVARVAGVDKVLIYRYFGGLAELLEAYGESQGFWPSREEVLGRKVAVIKALPKAERVEAVLLGLLDALRQRPQTIEVLAWEAVQQSPLTAMLAERREAWSRQILAELFDDAGPEDRPLLTLASLLVAGFQYLLIRARRGSVYGGIALDSEAGWAEVRDAIRRACRAGCN